MPWSETTIINYPTSVRQRFAERWTAVILTVLFIISLPKPNITMNEDPPPHPDGLPYPGSIDYTWINGSRVVQGYQAKYILAAFDEHLRLRTSDGFLELRILTLRDVVSLALVIPSLEENSIVISLDLDWFSVLREAENLVEALDDSKFGPIEGKEQLRALRRSTN